MSQVMSCSFTIHIDELVALEVFIILSAHKL